MASEPEDLRSARFRLGEWLVAPNLNQLSRGETVARVRPKVMDVLVVLAAHPGEVVAKETILDAVWAKKFLADSALSRAICELRETLGDEAHGSTYVETIPKRGYRLIAPVHEVASSRGGDPPDGVAGASPPLRGRAAAVVWPALAAALLLLAGLAAGHGARAPRPEGPHAPKRILVLPFDNVGAADDDYLAAAMADEIAGRLTKVSGVAVVSPPRRVSPAGLHDGATAIARRAGVDYALAASVQCIRGGGGPGRVKITPRLVRAADDTQVWGDVFEYPLEDVFHVQSEIARRVIAEVGVALSEPQRRVLEERPTASVEAWQAFRRGVHYTRLPEARVPDVRLALQMFERAVSLDPQFAAAVAGIGHANSLLYHRGLRATDEHRVRARQAFDRALVLAPGDPTVHMFHALYLYWCDRAYDEALAEVAVARRAWPESSGPREIAGLILRRRGDWETAVSSFLESARLEPGNALADYQAGLTLGLMRRFEDADSCFGRAIAALPDDAASYAAKAENLVRWKGDLAGARRVLEAAPGRDAPPLARAWFWQELRERRPDDAIARVGPLSVLGAGASDLEPPPALLLATAHRLAGHRREARASYASALATLDEALRAAPGNPYLRVFRGIALAGLERPGEAVEEGERAVAACPISGDAVDGAEVLEAAAELFALAGEDERAVDALARLLAVPSRVSAPSLAADPRWTSLRDHPRFRVMLAVGSASPAVPIDGAPGS